MKPLVPRKKNPRLPSLDALRGMVIACMLLVNGLPDFSGAYPALLHSSWEGLTLADMVMPGFIFAMGTSGSLVLARYNQARDADFLGRILRRSLILLLLGLLYNQLQPVLHYIFSAGESSPGLLAQIVEKGRIMGVLQRLGLVYLFGMLLARLLKGESLLNAAAFLLLLLYSASFHLYDAASPFSPRDNISMAVDGIFPGPAHCYLGGDFDPEGLYGTIAATASMLFGIAAGGWLREDRGPFPARMGRLFLHGGLLLAAGGLWSYTDAICKALWTAPYVLLTSGIFMWLLALLEISFSFLPRPMARLCAPWNWLGKNAILFYLLTEAGLITLWNIETASGEALYPWLWHVTLQGMGNEPLSILIFTCLWICLWLPLAWYLHRHDIMLRV